jgi:excisionase family DNA binding protein
MGVQQLAPTALLDAARDGKRLLSLASVARALGLRRATVRQLVERGVIRGTRLGKRWRVPIGELDKIARDGIRELEPRRRSSRVGARIQDHYELRPPRPPPRT